MTAFANLNNGTEILKQVLRTLLLPDRYQIEFMRSSTSELCTYALPSEFRSPTRHLLIGVYSSAKLICPLWFSYVFIPISR